jgi:hypothetical protein
MPYEDKQLHVRIGKSVLFATLAGHSQLVSAIVFSVP